MKSRSAGVLLFWAARELSRHPARPAVLGLSLFLLTLTAATPLVLNQALRDLTEISEPLKIYTRNRGGTQYQVYSPFTLFADACTADAALARPFKKAVDSYLEEGNANQAALLKGYFEKWRSIYVRLELIQEGAPLVDRILPYSKRVRDVSALMISGLDKGSLTRREYEELRGLLNEEDDPELNLDVELAVKEEILALGSHLAGI